MSKDTTWFHCFDGNGKHLVSMTAKKDRSDLYDPRINRTGPVIFQEADPEWIKNNTPKEPND